MTLTAGGKWRELVAVWMHGRLVEDVGYGDARKWENVPEDRRDQYLEAADNLIALADQEADDDDGVTPVARAQADAQACLDVDDEKGAIEVWARFAEGSYDV